MTCVLVLPGALLPADLAPEVLRAANASVLAGLARGARLAPLQVLPWELSPGAAHLHWLWRYFGGDGLPITAPYAWRALGGPALATELWACRPAHCALARDHMALAALDGSPPSPAELEARAPAVREAAAAAGCVLQELDEHWFLSRTEPWDLQVRAWESQLDQAIGPESASGAAVLAWRRLTNEVQMHWEVAGLNAEREAAGRLTINSVWIEGGGVWRRLRPATVRAVMSDEAAVRGWALAAGLPDAAVTPVRERWPEATRGDRLAVLSELLPAWRLRDWGQWLACLPALEARVAALVEQARAAGHAEVRLVATGGEHARELIHTPAGWRVWRSWRAPNVALWLTEPELAP
ncbi:MAG TPA: hypothetical protein PK326_08805 [Burkholderiaceae bacterium]|nr:hypothetical protein [Burkholderiaceae bacterium]